MKDAIYQNYLKRLFDFVGAGILLLFFAPVLLVTSLVILCKMGRPIFFRQQRAGKDEQLFWICKFRTMKYMPAAEWDVADDEARLTDLGKFLRETSLDELPELWNIFKGEMSFVGPRPLTEDYLPFYTESENKRHRITPGLTGLAQINGRNFLSWDDRLALDVEYYHRQSLKLDLKICLITAKKVLFREDVASGVELAEGDLTVIRAGIRKAVKKE